MLREKNLLLAMVLAILLISLLAGCGGPAATTGGPTTPTTQAATPTASTTPTTATAKPTGDLVAALNTFGNENWLPWLDPMMANMHDLVYDFLIYWDCVNRKFIPGLAESWEVSPDAMTLTYHLRKGVQFQDGWGEFTSADVKYNFEMQASRLSVGKVSQTRRIASMDTPDPYVLVVHFKDAYPTFFVDMSMGNSTVCQGMVCKKYIETVGEEVASQKPIGTGPYKMVESKLGDNYKFEALDTHWRVVPEFKTLTVRLVTETGTLIAALKNKEIDMAQVPGAQVADLKSAKVAVELSPVGGQIIMALFGGMVIPADKRYDATIHNKDPWVDPKVRKAMALAIDREAICKAIYNGYAEPAGVPNFGMNMDQYRYAYDPTAAKQLLKEAGYPNGFSFKAISYTQIGYPEMPSVIEALTGYWQQIGLDPKITIIDYNTYNSKNRAACKTAGEISLGGNSPVADLLSRIELNFMPNVMQVYYEDEGSYKIYSESPKSTFEERTAVSEKLNQYYYENVGPIPIVRMGLCYAWNPDKMSALPRFEASYITLAEYARHAKPLNTFRLFSLYPDR